MSLNLKVDYENYVQTVDSEEYESIFGWPSAKAPRFEVFQGDMFDHEWHHADMIFANSTCFTP